MDRSRTILQQIVLPYPAASQAEVDSGGNTTKYVTPSTLKSKALKGGTYATELTFDEDKDIFQDVSTPSFTLSSSGNINGMGVILRLNTPTSVTFSSDFEAHPNSAEVDPTKLNMFILVFFSNWNGLGSDKVIYMNHLLTAI